VTNTEDYICEILFCILVHSLVSWLVQLFCCTTRGFADHADRCMDTHVDDTTSVAVGCICALCARDQYNIDIPLLARYFLKFW